MLVGNTKERRLFRKDTSSTAGFSLIELVTAMGISVLVLSMVILILQRMLLDQGAAADRMDNQTSSIQAQGYLLQFLSQAIDLYSDGGGNLNFYSNPGSPQGWIINYDSATAPASASPVTIAVFNREDGGASPRVPANGSVFRQTGLYFLQPTSTTPGIIFIDVGSNVSLGANYGDLFFPGLVQFQVSIPVPAGASVPYANITMVYRHFLPGSGPEVWCRQANFGACSTIPHYRGFRDVTTSFTVPFSDNVSATSPGNFPETEVGNVYFFPIYHK